MKITVKYTEGLHENDNQIYRKATRKWQSDIQKGNMKMTIRYTERQHENDSQIYRKAPWKSVLSIQKVNMNIAVKYTEGKMKINVEYIEEQLEHLSFLKDNVISMYNIRKLFNWTI